MNRPKSDHDDAAWAFYKFFYGINDKKLTINNASIDVNGDVSFNFLHKNERNVRMLLPSIFPKALEKDAEHLHESLNNFRYSFLNISVLPMTGGLNDIKKNYADDRFDSFIYLLSQYYKGVTAPIGNRGNRGSYFSNQSILMNFLNAVGSVENFVKLIYGIDNKKLIKDMIKSGSKAICTCDDYLDYMELAIRFWRLRLNLLYKRAKATKPDARKDSEKAILSEHNKYKNMLNTLEENINTLRHNLPCKKIKNMKVLLMQSK